VRIRRSSCVHYASEGTNRLLVFLLKVGGAHEQRRGAHGVEVIRLVGGALRLQEVARSGRRGHPPLSRGLNSPRRVRLRRGISISRAAVPVARGPAPAVAKLRCENLRLLLQTSQGSSRRAAKEQRHRIDDGHICEEGAPPVTGPPCRGSVLIFMVESGRGPFDTSAAGRVGCERGQSALGA
jgi:hypothetical protein